ncbi:MAG: proline--tRNA ligase [Bdellovibrio sp.]
MRWSQIHLHTLKEAPADAEILSHRLLVRAGMIRKLAPGIFTYSSLFLRAVRRFENIIREELDSRGCQEILMPMVQPQALWEETHRWVEMGEGLLKFKNRNQQGFCLGATHEEAVVDYVRQDLKSFRDLPQKLYQIQTKYRDEIRPRFGLLRGREFLMKDAYSFDRDPASALESYRLFYEAYQSIFDRLGLQYRIVQADAGNIGGSQTHEFQLLAAAGEDALLVGENSSFAANVEVCPAIDFEGSFVPADPILPLEKFATPGLRSMEDLSNALGLPSRSLVKSIFVATAQGKTLKEKSPICILLRGSDELNLVKVKNFLKLSIQPEMLDPDQVNELTGAWPGSCGPLGLSIPIYMDHGLVNFRNFICGANENDFHCRNLNSGRDFRVQASADLRMAVEGDRDPSGSGRLKSYRGIEVGHVFYLGTKYSEKMKLQFLDSQGRAQLVEMGCFGIGVTRTVQASLEQSHDADGIIWPPSISPVDVHICLLDPQDHQSQEVCSGIEEELKRLGKSVFIDDREERPGVKFKDADLLGFPLRVVIGKKGLASRSVEFVERKTKKIQILSLDELGNELRRRFGR